ncbi:Lrp/AsnC family transcriptional regulator [Halanaerobium praevalens]|uniref:siroheme decarboxylase n=1 Tax=Halanaerobium praevalens (strain ATCC 33744 / DSM 2228 / GSL) TaxID=572479 RepID=E3DMX5_HALPG|nr:Lrp/AsnC family transcriptional regulator [Halanaerobium praevalens]ADO77464.1 putative transcriptional regulator, AsnC family [Halanaerobium praevalens DSM 2228]
MEKIDKKILDRLQKGLDLESSPFQKIASELMLKPEKLLERIKRLKKEGYIRRLGGVFKSASLGYQSTLIALKVEETEFYNVAEIINQHPGVTHNYRRDNKLNLWFTLSTATKSEQKNFLDKIKVLRGVKELYKLPKEKFFKLNVFFQMNDEGKKDDLNE